MKNLFLALGLAFTLITITNSCDPCTSCGPVISEPTIEATFYNVDSLILIQDSIVIVDTLKIVTDSLLVVVDSIENGGSLAAEKLALENYIDGLTYHRTGKTDSAFANCLDSLGLELTSQESLLNSGRTAIDFLQLVNTGLDITKDSSVYHYLPLLLTSNESNFNLDIGDESFAIDVNYSLSDSLDVDRRVVRLAYVQSLAQSGFDSLFCICNGTDTVSCSTLKCDALSTSITAYF